MYFLTPYAFYPIAFCKCNLSYYEKTIRCYFYVDDNFIIFFAVQHQR